MFFSRFFKFLKYFGQGYEMKLIYILFMSFMSSLLEFLGIVLVFPFILLMVNPGRVINNPVALYFEQHFGIHGVNNLILLVGGLIATVIIIKNMYCIYITYVQNKLISQWGLEIKNKMLDLYLYAPYEADIKHGKLNMVKNLTKNIDVVMQFYVFKFISMISNTFVIILIFAILTAILPLFTIIAILFFTVAGLYQNRFFQNISENLSIEKHKLTAGPYNSVINGLSNIKEIKVNGCQKFFYDFFSKISGKIIPYNEKLTLIPLIPQYIIEIIFVLTMIILCYGILTKYGESPSNILISFGIVAIAIYRVVPQIYKNQIYINYINIHAQNTDELFNLYDEYQKYEYAKEKDTKEKISFTEKIQTEELSYSYDKKNYVLYNINLEIKKGEFVGIVGLSGAGKSTLVDCLLGLLDYEGRICVDNTELTTENIRTFRNITGYVPQKISTTEGDIYSNVAWGTDRQDIDKERVDNALKEAQLYDQLKQTENGLGIELKEDGSGLSGGQMQRIGIARALYRNPEIIIFDEATSNLDVKTESKLTEIITSFRGEKTIIAIAHRLSTLISCDRIIYLKEGRLIDTGTFKELSRKYKDFKEIIKLSRINFEEENQEE